MMTLHRSWVRIIRHSILPATGWPRADKEELIFINQLDWMIRGAVGPIQSIWVSLSTLPQQMIIFPSMLADMFTPHARTVVWMVATWTSLF